MIVIYLKLDDSYEYVDVSSYKEVVMKERMDN